MNIYDARKLQKQLYKQAQVDFKSSFIEIIKGELYYVNSIQMNEENHVLLSGNDNFLKAINQMCEYEDLDVLIVYAIGTKRGGTKGMYISQLIKID